MYWRMEVNLSLFYIDFRKNRDSTHRKDTLPIKATDSRRAIMSIQLFPPILTPNNLNYYVNLLFLCSSFGYFRNYYAIVVQ